MRGSSSFGKSAEITGGGFGLRPAPGRTPPEFFLGPPLLPLTPAILLIAFDLGIFSANGEDGGLLSCNFLDFLPALPAAPGCSLRGLRRGFFAMVYSA